MNLTRLIAVLETMERAWEAGRFPDEKDSRHEDLKASLQEVRCAQEMVGEVGYYIAFPPLTAAEREEFRQAWSRQWSGARTCSGRTCLGSPPPV